MSALAKKSAAKRLASMTAEQKSEWGKRTVKARWEKRNATKPLGTDTASNEDSSENNNAKNL